METSHRTSGSGARWLDMDYDVVGRMGPAPRGRLGENRSGGEHVSSPALETIYIDIWSLGVICHRVATSPGANAYILDLLEGYT